jgi:hypothetical protein
MLQIRFPDGSANEGGCVPKERGVKNGTNKNE